MHTRTYTHSILTPIDTRSLPIRDYITYEALNELSHFELQSSVWNCTDHLTHTCCCYCCVKGHVAHWSRQILEPCFVPDFPPDFAGSSCWAGRGSSGVSCLASRFLSRGMSGILFWAYPSLRARSEDRKRPRLPPEQNGRLVCFST